MRNKIVLACAIVLALCVSWAVCCDEGVCVSIVSKCLLIKSCDCDMTSLKNCTCCKDCQLCLSKLYTECCSCVGLCPKPDPDDDLQDGSTIEDLHDPIPELFNVLTEQEDIEKRWTTFILPVHFDVLTHKSNHGILDLSKDKRQEVTKDTYGADLNCTVAFMSQCYSLRKCKESCKSMGAARYRWFHEQGCCQCIGDTCISYGLNSPKCLQCPPQEDEAENQLEEVNKLIENTVDEEEDLDEEFDEDEDELDEEEEEEGEEDRGINELKSVG